MQQREMDIIVGAKKCISNYDKGRYKDNPARQKNNSLHSNYGITIKQYNQMLVSQNGTCAICKKPETRLHNREKGNIKSLVVDHDHNSGDVRALLCSDCNTALGLLREDTERMRAMADYVEYYQTREPSVKIIQMPLILDETQTLKMAQ